MGQALYRTYRSKKLSEIVGQEHITTALDRALKKGIISHAYLFTGPRGTGKTSIARILAHEINGLPYTEDRQHLDIIEIDAASNRRIDEIRDLRDKVHMAPSSAKYKVYIIDEVHMLTKEAFNALLKTLEEPPAHVVFMLATTEAHKLPETIISRTQRFSLKPVDLDKVVGHLRFIADTEKIIIDDAALGLVAAHGEGSFRDSISLLDQARHASDAVTLSDVQRILGIAPEELIASILAALNAHDPVALTQQLVSMREQGYEPAQTARQLSTVIRASVIAGSSAIPHDTAMQLLTALVQVPASHDPGVSLEISLLDAALGPVAAKPVMAAHTAHAVAPARAPVRSIAPAQTATVSPSAPAPAQQAKPPDEPSKSFREIAAARAQESVGSNDAPSDIVIDKAIWTAVLDQLKKQHSTLHTATKFAKPSFTPGIITLSFAYSFHQKRFNDKRNKEIVSEIIKSVVGADILLRCILDENDGSLPPDSNEVTHTVTASPAAAPQPAAPVKPAAPQSAEVAAISNIFGSAEVLES